MVKKEMIEKRQGSTTEDKSGREDLTVKENTLERRQGSNRIYPEWEMKW